MVQMNLNFKLTWNVDSLVNMTYHFWPSPDLNRIRVSYECNRIRDKNKLELHKMHMNASPLFSFKTGEKKKKQKWCMKLWVFYSFQVISTMKKIDKGMELLISISYFLICNTNCLFFFPTKTSNLLAFDLSSSFEGRRILIVYQVLKQMLRLGH